jgi:hypothetical protein
VLDEKSAADDVAVLFLIGQGGEPRTTFTCEVVGIKEDVEVRGTLLCLILAPLSSKENHLFHCLQANGKSKVKQYSNDQNNAVVALLLTKFGAGAFEESGLLTLMTLEFGTPIQAVAFMNE